MHLLPEASESPGPAGGQGARLPARSSTGTVRPAHEMPARPARLGLYHWFGPKNWEMERVLSPLLLLGAGSEGFVAAGEQPCSAGDDL